MPYGISKKQGGDSPSNVRFMERCVKRVMRQKKGYSKGRAIAICKKSLERRKKK